jgi:protein-export membrane protein SecD/preprotein translocase SecF subunit
VKREGLWVGAIVVLVALSIIAIIKLPARYGLDIKGGARAVLQAQMDGKPLTPDMHKVLLDIITRRVNATGVAEPSIQPKGTDQFIVELPNATNKDELVKQIGTTAKMEFRYFQQVQSERNRFARYRMDIEHADGQEVYSFTDTNPGGGRFRDEGQIESDFQKLMQASGERAGATPYKLPAALVELAPSDRTIYFDADQAKKATALGTELEQFKAFLDTAPVKIDGSELSSDCKAHLDPAKGPVVSFTMKPAGREKFAEFTTQHTKEIMAILLDNRVITAPNITEPITGGETEISGGFKSLSEAVTLADLINAGALPVPLKIVQNESVEATLGHDALKDMIKAGVVGLILVLVFMAGYYLLPGLVADVALILYGLFTIAVFKGALSWFIPPVTMTLPGIAGFILSVGMAVDANILIFERLKEELRNGKPLRQAIDAGFKRAFTAIRDSNICTIITCIILYSMGTPTVKGFALTLGIGVVVSLFTAITVTRTLLYLLYDAGAGKKPEWFGLGRQWLGGTRFKEGTNVTADAGRPQLHVINHRKVFYGISLAIIIPGIVFWCMGGLKRSIEFTGGTQVEVLFDTPVTQAQINDALDKAGLKEHLVQIANGGKVAYVSIKGGKAEDVKSSLRDVPNALMGRADAAPDAAKTTATPAPTAVTAAPTTAPAAPAPAPPAATTPAPTAPAPTAPAAPVSGSPAAPVSPAPVDATPAAAPVQVATATGSDNSETNDYMRIAFDSGPGLAAPAASPVQHPALDSLGIKYHRVSHSLVGGVISAELTQQAFQAVVVASILIVLYLAFAFGVGGFVAGLRFGTSAIVALLHDVLLLIGAFAIFGYFMNWEIDSLFITATLTVVGFSVHDTIVIFDRLRENLRHRLKGESFEDLANRSILQSFARSINTSFTVVLTLLAMLFLGEPSTRLLVVALLIGIVSGTYSSIFNATPILVDWEMWLAKRRNEADDRPAPPTPSAPKPVEPKIVATPAVDGSTGQAPRSAKPRRGGATKRF